MTTLSLGNGSGLLYNDKLKKKKIIRDRFVKTAVFYTSKNLILNLKLF